MHASHTIDDVVLAQRVKQQAREAPKVLRVLCNDAVVHFERIAGVPAPLRVHLGQQQIDFDGTQPRVSVNAFGTSLLHGKLCHLARPLQRRVRPVCV